MKKYLLCIFVLLTLLCSCSDEVDPYGDNSVAVSISDGYIFDSTSSSYGLLSCDNNAEQNKTETEAVTVPATSFTADNPSVIQGEFRGVWLSYYEIDVTNETSTEEKYTAYIESLCDKFAPYGITDVFAHVRAYADAIYESDCYPVSKYAAGVQGGELPFDCLEIICRVMASHGIRVHAWINPYRVHNGTDINELSADNKARQWYNPSSNEDVAIVGEKIYFNPASQKAQQLVVQGAAEILEKYPVAGIHIDDYFYPPECGDFDSAQYSSFLLSGGNLSLDDWRRSNVNSLVSSLYKTVKSYGSSKIFSISPAGNIDNNYESLYADVELWCKGGYADMIIPQIYFGFEHSSRSFDSCTDAWLSLKGAGVSMPVGLALYKSGKEDSYAGAGISEWTQQTNIIARQVQYLRSRGCDGFVIFSAEYFFEEGTYPSVELANLRQII